MVPQELQGVIAGREFVWWYNGHPEYKDFPVDLTSSDTAIILGQVRPPHASNDRNTLFLAEKRKEKRKKRKKRRRKEMVR